MSSLLDEINEVINNDSEIDPDILNNLRRSKLTESQPKHASTNMDEPPTQMTLF